jgi:hypothetical protein
MAENLCFGKFKVMYGFRLCCLAGHHFCGGRSGDLVERSPLSFALQPELPNMAEGC